MELVCMYAAIFECKIYAFLVHVYGSVGVCDFPVQSSAEADAGIYRITYSMYYILLLLKMMCILLIFFINNKSKNSFWVFHTTPQLLQP